MEVEDWFEKYWYQVTIGVLVIGSLIYYGPDLHRHFGGRYADAERDIHVKSTSFVQGTISHLQRLQMDYTRATNDGHRESIRQLVLVSVANIDETKLPPHLAKWVAELRREP